MVKGLGIPERIEDMDDPLETIRRLLAGGEELLAVNGDELQAAIELLCSIEDARRVAEMELTIDLDPIPPVRDGEVVLYGFDGQVDLVQSIPDRPAHLLLPLRPRLRYTDAGVEPWDWDGMYRTARYDRVGENTYVRVE